MKVVLLTPVRLFGEGLAGCLDRRADISLVGTVRDLAELGELLEVAEVDLVLIDVTQGIELEEVRAISAQRPDLTLMALGLVEQRQEVIRCGRAGFAGYVARDASVAELCKALCDVAAGRLECSAEISGGLLRALFRMETQPDPLTLKEALTRREGEVLQLLGRALSNKEIARELNLSVATVKNHVHKVLDKLDLQRRTQVMRRVREAPWIVPVSPIAQQRRTEP